MPKRKLSDPMNTVCSNEMVKRVPYYPYARLGAFSNLETVDSAEAQKLAAEMSGVTALSVVAAGLSGYGLARMLKRNRGEAIQAALVGWFGSFAVHYFYHALKR